MAELLVRRGQGSGSHPVGDLRLTTSVSAGADATWVHVDLREGRRTYRFSLPGPAATDDARAHVIVEDPNTLPLRVEADKALRLVADRATRFLVQNIDDRLSFELDGSVLVEQPIAPASDQRSSVTIELEGGGARFEDLHVARDIYYTNDFATVSEWRIPADSYLVLGDNTQDSADAREWQLARLRVRGVGPDPLELRGNLEGPRNPRVVRDEDTSTTFFRDEFGELHWYPSTDVQRLPPIESSFVPRHLIVGRALAVFWPLAPKLNVYRLHWIR